MGLDMYLYASRYQNKVSWREDKKPLEYPHELKDLEKDIEQRNFLSATTKYQIGYWRKFNALHNYIVKHYANGEDNCQEIYIGAEDIEEMLDICKRIHEDLKTCPKLIKEDENYKYEIYDSKLAEELLPPKSGFFFGSLEIDEWYKKDIEYTIELFEKVLKIGDEYQLIYGASW